MSKEFFRLEGVRKAFGGTDGAGMPREGAAAGRATGQVLAGGEGRMPTQRRFCTASTLR